MALRRSAVAAAGLALAFVLRAEVSRATFDGLQCSGHLVSLGESTEAVLAECGPPSSVVSRYFGPPRRQVYVEWWTYERRGSFPRVLRFRNGRLLSIVAASRFRD